MRLLAVAAFAALAALSAFAEDKVDMKVNVKKGLKYTRTEEIKGEGGCKIQIGNLVMQSKASVNYTVKQVEEIQDVKDGSPAQIHRAYPSRTSTINMGLTGEKETAHPLEGADITWKGGVWTVVSGGSGEAAKVISNEIGPDALTAAISSGKSQTAGSTWDADKEKVKAWIASQFPGSTVESAEMECKLCEFREKDGRKCARIEINMKATGKIDLEAAPQSAITITMKGDVFYATDTGIVILAKGEGKLKADVEMKTDQGEGKLNTEIPLEWNVSVKVGEADFEASKPVAKPKPVKPEWFPPPWR